jgi:hypothetical protein
MVYFWKYAFLDFYQIKFLGGKFNFLKILNH